MLKYCSALLVASLLAMGCMAKGEEDTKIISSEDSYLLLADGYEYDDKQETRVLVLKNCIQIRDTVKLRSIEGKYVIKCDDVKLQAFLRTSLLPIYPQLLAKEATLLPFETVDYFQGGKPVVQIYKTVSPNLQLEKNVSPDSIFMFLPSKK